MRGDGRGILFLTVGRVLRDRQRRMKLMGGMRDIVKGGLKDRGKEERDAEEEKELGNF